MIGRIVRTAAVAGSLVGLSWAALAQPAPRVPRGAGYNCEAVQVGFSGAQPFSCPLPGPRRLGARCFCEQPFAPFTGYRPPLAGEVVP